MKDFSKLIMNVDSEPLTIIYTNDFDIITYVIASVEEFEEIFNHNYSKKNKTDFLYLIFLFFLNVYNY